jgi:hypothetical protein
MASRSCRCARFAGCTLLCLLICFSARLSQAQSLSTLISSSGSSDGVAVSKSLQLNVPIDSRNAFFVGAEYVRDTSMPDAFVSEVKGKHSWKFKGVPVTVGYMHYLTPTDQPIVPVVGVGLSYYFCRAKQHETAPGPAFDANVLGKDFEKRYGMGYGAEATLGLRAELSRHAFVMAEGRGRYVNGLAFADGDDLGAQYVKFDFSIGVGFKF